MDNNLALCTSEIENLLGQNKLIILGGAGISSDSPSKAPLWNDLLLRIIEYCEQIQDILPDHLKFQSTIEAAKRDYQKSQILTAEILKNEILKVSKVEALAHYQINIGFSKRFSALFNAGQPNDWHKTIVGTNYPFILTTNYDEYLEAAAQEQSLMDLSLRSYTYKSKPDFLATSIYNRIPCIIHVHGKFMNDGIDDVILTTKDYFDIKKKYPGFQLVLQNLLINYSILLVGYGAKDPHIEEIITEISYYFNFSSSSDLPQIYMILKKDELKDLGDIFRAHKTLSRTKIIEVDDFSEELALLQRFQSCSPAKRSPA